jgi:hypothetical protein
MTDRGGPVRDLGRSNRAGARADGVQEVAVMALHVFIVTLRGIEFLENGLA